MLELNIPDNSSVWPLAARRINSMLTKHHGLETGKICRKWDEMSDGASNENNQEVSRVHDTNIILQLIFSQSSVEIEFQY